MSAPYAGAKISLISKSRIRYEGILFSIDPEKSTVALKNVRSFGTEDRRPEATIGPSSEVWECIIFRGSDIDDLHVCEAPQTAMPADPAIVSMPPTMGYPGYPPNYPYPYGGYYPPPYGYHPAYPAPPGAAAFPPGVAAPAPPHAGENARQPTLDTAAAFTDPSAAAAAPAASFSPFGGSNPLIITPAKESSDAAAPRKEAQPAPQPASTPATATTPAPNTTLPSSSPSASPSPASTPASPSPSSSPAPSTPSSKAPLLASTAGPASTSTPPSSSPAPQAASGARKPHYGADHERAETAVAAAAPAPAATGDILQPFDFAASNALWEKPKQVESSPAKAYVKTSFFDSISCETTDRQVNPGRPPSLQEQRALDSETFGSVAVQDRERTNRQSRYHHPRGGRGGRGSRYHRGGSSRGGYSDHGSRPPRTDRTE